jgi:EF hand
MTTSCTKINLALLGALLLIVAGCGGPSAITAPSVSGSSAASAAMEQYDTNSDGVISGDELKKAPCFVWLFDEIDTDSDKGISADEIESRIQLWKDRKAGLQPFKLTLIYKKKPLKDARVILEPEAFLGGAVPAAEGITGFNGQVNFRIPNQPDKLPGVNPGFYKVKITSDSVNLPAKYNDETILGVEASGNIPYEEERPTTIKLKKK